MLSFRELSNSASCSPRFFAWYYVLHPPGPLSRRGGPYHPCFRAGRCSIPYAAPRTAVYGVTGAAPFCTADFIKRGPREKIEEICNNAARRGASILEPASGEMDACFLLLGTLILIYNHVYHLWPSRTVPKYSHHGGRGHCTRHRFSFLAVLMTAGRGRGLFL